MQGTLNYLQVNIPKHDAITRNSVWQTFFRGVEKNTRKIFLVFFDRYMANPNRHNVSSWFVNIYSLLVQFDGRRRHKNTETPTRKCLFSVGLGLPVFLSYYNSAPRIAHIMIISNPLHKACCMPPPGKIAPQ